MKLHSAGEEKRVYASKHWKLYKDASWSLKRQQFPKVQPKVFSWHLWYFLEHSQVR